MGRRVISNVATITVANINSTSFSAGSEQNLAKTGGMIVPRFASTTTGVGGQERVYDRSQNNEFTIKVNNEDATEVE